MLKCLMDPRTHYSILYVSNDICHYWCQRHLVRKGADIEFLMLITLCCTFITHCSFQIEFPCGEKN